MTGDKISELSDKIRNVFSGSGLDAMVIMNTSKQDSNFLYLTGFTSGIFEESILIVRRNGVELLTSILEYETAEAEAPHGLSVHKVSDRDSISKYMKALNGKGIGINESFLPVSYKRLIAKLARPKSMTDCSYSFAAARRIKSPKELERMRHAVSVTKSVLSDISNHFKDGMTEVQLAARFEYLQMERGCHTSFPSIVAFGSNASMPHYMPGRRKLHPNTFVLMDVGAKYQNYCSDISRTFIYKPDRKSSRYKRINEMCDTVIAAQELALRQMYAGNISYAVHKVASDYINKAHMGKYKGRFIHALGHSIGIDVHDGDVISSNKLILKENMVFSDEPGIYIKGFGGVRMEDDVLIGKGRSRFM